MEKNQNFAPYLHQDREAEVAERVEMNEDSVVPPPEGQLCDLRAHQTNHFVAPRAAVTPPYCQFTTLYTEQSQTHRQSHFPLHF